MGQLDDNALMAAAADDDIEEVRTNRQIGGHKWPKIARIIRMETTAREERSKSRNLIAFSLSPGKSLRFRLAAQPHLAPVINGD